MRPSILYPLFAPIEVLKGIGNKYAKLVKNLCGEKVIDVLFHLPVSVVDRTWMPPLVSGTKWQNMDRNCNCYRTPAAADAQTSVSDLLYGRHGGACIGIF